VYTPPVKLARLSRFRRGGARGGKTQRFSTDQVSDQFTDQVKTPAQVPLTYPLPDSSPVEIPSGRLIEWSMPTDALDPTSVLQNALSLPRQVYSYLAGHLLRSLEDDDETPAKNS